MTQSTPFLTLSNTVLWLKVMLTAATLVLLYFRYRAGKKPGAASKALSLRTKVAIGFAVLFSFAVFHNLGAFRGGTFVHHAEMFHYYLGPKYFKEVGYHDLYNAVIVADTEQGNALAQLPFYTDLKTYQNTPRETALADAARIKSLFSEERWNEFKNDVAFFKTATGMPQSTGFFFLLIDHGYNASPVSTFVLGSIANAVPVTQLRLLAGIDVLLMAAMIALVFRTFGFEMGALFSVYFFVSMLSGQEYLSGSFLRYDWLLYIVAAVCLLDKGRYASSAFFLTLSAMMRIFPALLFYGIAVAILRKAKTTRSVDRTSVRFILATGVTALGLFLLPALSLGSVLQPWKDFYAKADLHDNGVYVNHLGLRSIALFESSHLSLERFVETYKRADSNDIVRNWQDVKENELRAKRPAIVFASLLVLLALTAIVWKTKASESEGLVWSLFLVYATSYLASYYYAFLCLFVLLFFRRPLSLRAFVPLGLLLTLNLGALVTDYFQPSPIVFFTLVNIYLFMCLASILGFELYANVFGRTPQATVASLNAPPEPGREVKRRRPKARARRK
jgi:hypothetical protein